MAFGWALITSCSRDLDLKMPLSSQARKKFLFIHRQFSKSLCNPNEESIDNTMPLSGVFKAAKQGCKSLKAWRNFPSPCKKIWRQWMLWTFQSPLKIKFFIQIPFLTMGAKIQRVKKNSHYANILNEAVITPFCSLKSLGS